MVSAVQFRLCNPHLEPLAVLGGCIPDVKALVVKMMDTAVQKEQKLQKKNLSCSCVLWWLQLYNARWSCSSSQKLSCHGTGQEHKSLRRKYILVKYLWITLLIFTCWIFSLLASFRASITQVYLTALQKQTWLISWESKTWWFFLKKAV